MRANEGAAICSISRDEMARRIRNLRKRMDERAIDVLVVFSAPGSLRFGQRGHVLYLSGYEPYFGDCMLILPQDEKIHPLLQTDSADYSPETCTWITQRVKAGDHIQVIRDYLADNGLANGRIGIAGEYSVSPRFFTRLIDQLEPPKIQIASEILEAERAVKSEFELRCLKQAAAVAAKGFEAAASFIEPGITESDLVGEVERVCRKHGSQSFPHYTMVVSGKDREHVSYWWNCRKREMQAGDPVSMDFGTMYNGYCADICRPIVIGKATDKQRDVFKVLIDAHHAAAEAAKPGVMASEVNRAAGRVLTAAWGDHGWWGIGHGVGLEVHEWPFIGYQHIVDDEAYRDATLVENMVISLEPSVYFPDVGDFQIEDQFVVTRGGAERLNQIPHSIVEV
jgi:Xaa-Pro aminopeptidase